VLLNRVGKLSRLLKQWSFLLTAILQVCMHVFLSLCVCACVCVCVCACVCVTCCYQTDIELSLFILYDTFIYTFHLIALINHFSILDWNQFILDWNHFFSVIKATLHIVFLKGYILMKGIWFSCRIFYLKILVLKMPGFIEFALWLCVQYVSKGDVKTNQWRCLQWDVLRMYISTHA